MDIIIYLLTLECKNAIYLNKYPIDHKLIIDISVKFKETLHYSEKLQIFSEFKENKLVQGYFKDFKDEWQP